MFSQQTIIDTTEINFIEKPSNEWLELFKFKKTAELNCPCFTEKMLDSLFQYKWKEAWWSDVPGCKIPPYHEMLEVYIVHAGLPKYDFNFTAQAGLVDGQNFVSSNVYNNITKKFEWRCGGGDINDSIAIPCTKILKNFIQKIRKIQPDIDYCGINGGLGAKKINAYTPPPAWKTPKYLLTFGFLISLIAFLVTLIILRKKYESKKQELKRKEIEWEKQKSIEEERTRIAMEMHDDVGSSLTTINYLSQIALEGVEDAKMNKEIQKISKYSRELSQNMAEIIWALNSQFDSVDDLTSYIRKMAAEILTEHDILFKSNINITSNISINGEKRRNVMLIIKEILHNIVKHSGATEVFMEIEVHNEDYVVKIVENNGVGFDMKNVKTGNGLNNIQKRAKLSGVKYTFNRSEKGMEYIVQI